MVLEVLPPRRVLECPPWGHHRSGPGDTQALGPKAPQEGQRGHAEGHPTWRTRSPTSSAKPSGESYKIELKARIKSLGEGNDARLPSPRSLACALSRFRSGQFPVSQNKRCSTALMSHPKNENRYILLCVRHKTLVLLPTDEICPPTPAESNPAGAPEAFSAGQHSCTEKLRVFHPDPRALQPGRRAGSVAAAGGALGARSAAGAGGGPRSAAFCRSERSRVLTRKDALHPMDKTSAAPSGLQREREGAPAHGERRDGIAGSAKGRMRNDARAVKDAALDGSVGARRFAVRAVGARRKAPCLTGVCSTQRWWPRAGERRRARQRRPANLVWVQRRWPRSAHTDHGDAETVASPRPSQLHHLCRCGIWGLPTPLCPLTVEDDGDDTRTGCSPPYHAGFSPQLPTAAFHSLSMQPSLGCSSGAPSELCIVPPH